VLLLTAVQKATAQVDRIIKNEELTKTKFMKNESTPTPSWTQAIRILAPIALVILAVVAFIYMAYSQ